MIRLSIPLRQVLARLSLPIMIAVAFGVMLLGKADTLLVERLRNTLSDALAPIYAAISHPVNAVDETIEEIRYLATLRSDNAKLREENERLRRWHAAALGLEAENTLLRRQLGFMPEGAPNFHAARVVEMAAAPMPARYCFPSRRSMASARGRWPWMNAALSAA